MEEANVTSDLKSYKIILPNYDTIIKANKLQILNDTGQTVFFNNRDTVGIVPKEALIEQIVED